MAFVNPFLSSVDIHAPRTGIGRCARSSGVFADYLEFLASRASRFQNGSPATVRLQFSETKSHVRDPICRNGSPISFLKKLILLASPAISMPVTVEAAFNALRSDAQALAMGYRRGIVSSDCSQKRGPLPREWHSVIHDRSDPMRPFGHRGVSGPSIASQPRTPLRDTLLRPPRLHSKR
jgi:hypothetical protein